MHSNTVKINDPLDGFELALVNLVLTHHGFEPVGPCTVTEAINSILPLDLRRAARIFHIIAELLQTARVATDYDYDSKHASEDDHE